MTYINRNIRPTNTAIGPFDGIYTAPTDSDPAMYCTVPETMKNPHRSWWQFWKPETVRNPDAGTWKSENYGQWWTRVTLLRNDTVSAK